MGNILIVDDSSLIRSVASRATVEAGHTAITATNGQEGLEAMDMHDIDMIFSDINMPIMGGIEMVSLIKQNSKFKFIPVVMLTTESDPQMKQKGKELGVKAWMLKPFNKQKFFTAVKKLMR